nr:MAG TPA: hypothetical protein [Caudoviricetes sp.]
MAQANKQARRRRISALCRSSVPATTTSPDDI